MTNSVKDIMKASRGNMVLFGHVKHSTNVIVGFLAKALWGDLRHFLSCDWVYAALDKKDNWVHPMPVSTIQKRGSPAIAIQPTRSGIG